MSILALQHINFGYKKNQTVLNDISLEIPNQSIYGFLGENGAGKTTTLKIIAGLMKPRKGDIMFQGEKYYSSSHNARSRMGSLIEAPSLYPHLNGINNLRIWSKYLKVPQSRINEVLELVELQAGKKKASEYSTGMKQRLGLAIALLNDPQLLILDEPTNGLDPVGLVAFRNILLRLKEEGKTIMLSSHLLTELEKVVDNLGIIHNGNVLFQGNLAELNELRSQNLELRIKVSDSTKAANALSNSTIINEQFISLEVNHEKEIPAILRKLQAEGLDIFELTQTNSGLEQLYLNLTKDQNIAQS